MLDGISSPSDAADLVTGSVSTAGVAAAVPMIPVCVLHPPHHHKSLHCPLRCFSYGTYDNDQKQWLQHRSHNIASTIMHVLHHYFKHGGPHEGCMICALHTVRQRLPPCTKQHGWNGSTISYSKHMCKSQISQWAQILTQLWPRIEVRSFAWHC